MAQPSPVYNTQKLTNVFLFLKNLENQKKNLSQLKCICTCDCWTFSGAVINHKQAQQAPVQSTQNSWNGFWFLQKNENQKRTVYSLSVFVPVTVGPSVEQLNHE